MDLVDKRILFALLKDARTPQRQIASRIGISAQTLNYRMGKMLDDGIIKNFIVMESPFLTGKVEGFAAFVSEREYSGRSRAKIKCLEKITLYGFEGENEAEINNQISKAAEELGNPVMRYFPKSISYNQNSRAIDREIINQLRKDPRANLSDIAKGIDAPLMRVKWRYNIMKKNNLLNVTVKVDLSKTDVVLFSIFSGNKENIRKALLESTIFSITDSNYGVFICFSENMVNAKEMINKVRSMEEKSEVMVIYDYDFFSG
ncbi:MAG: winged helix-turn-helix domain-containing protein [Thermoplasmataceae archaeon]|jgi:DNA-binding Lrp family transcriptional regulator